MIEDGTGVIESSIRININSTGITRSNVGTGATGGDPHLSWSGPPANILTFNPNLAPRLVWHNPDAVTYCVTLTDGQLRFIGLASMLL